MEYCQLYAYYKPVHLVIYKTSWLAMALFFLSLSLGEGIGNTQHKIDKNQLPLLIPPMKFDLRENDVILTSQWGNWPHRDAVKKPPHWLSPIISQSLIDFFQVSMTIGG